MAASFSALKETVKSHHLELMQSLENEYEQRFLALMRQKNKICSHILEQYHSLMRKIDSLEEENRQLQHGAVRDITISSLFSPALEQAHLQPQQQAAPPELTNDANAMDDKTISMMDDIPLEVQIDEENMQCDDGDVDDGDGHGDGDDGHGHDDGDKSVTSNSSSSDDSNSSKPTVPTATRRDECKDTVSAHSNDTVRRRRGRGRPRSDTQSQKPLKCQFCTYRASAKSTMVMHERIHTGVKPYACKLCGHRAAQKGAIVQHMNGKRCLEKQKLLTQEQKQQKQRTKNGDPDNGVCAACKREFATDTCQEQQWIECEFCNQWYHVHVPCSGLSDEDFNKYQTGQNAETFKCPSCKGHD